MDPNSNLSFWQQFSKCIENFTRVWNSELDDEVKRGFLVVDVLDPTSALYEWFNIYFRKDTQQLWLSNNCKIEISGQSGKRKRMICLSKLSKVDMNVLNTSSISNLHEIFLRKGQSISYSSISV